MRVLNGAAVVLSALAPLGAAAADKPNILVIMTDDVAPQDISAYHRGLGAITTPNIDKIAAQGMMVSDYYAQPSCTAGRAAFITGQYPIRTGLTSVGQPGSPIGLQKEDPTLAQLLKAEGYVTGQFGKSHVGDRNEFLPTVHGFDEFYGFLYHLNMMEMPEQPEFPKSPSFVGRPRNVIHTFDNEVLKRSLKWMKDSSAAKKPFFLWFNPSRMHQKIHVSKDWEGKSGHSAYADALLQLDWMVGELLNAVDQLGINDNTIILFTSDNGVNLAHWPDGGTASFRGEKGLTWDGGFRVPMLVRWPGRVPAGRWTGELMSSEDWVPTLMSAAGVPDIKEKLSRGITISDQPFRVHLDGYDQTDMLTGKGPTKRHEFFFYGETELDAFRVDQWKVHLAIKNEWIKQAEKIPGGLLIDIKLDPFERTPEAPGHFAWMTEKTWIAPIVGKPLMQHIESLKEFPPRQKGTGIGAATLGAN